MKNMIDPQLLAELKKKPVSFEGLNAILVKSPNITASQLCKLVDVEPQDYYRWKHLKSKANNPDLVRIDEFTVEPVSGKVKRYTAADKFKLISKYFQLVESKRTEFLRKFGLYASDISRWSALVETAAIEALSKRKSRSDKKPAEEIELANLKKEMRGQEKTIAKLAALVVIQKKVSEILNPTEED
jgi:hypothetical protein